jgi:Flp pilus assembly protein TadG
MRVKDLSRRLHRDERGVTGTILVILAVLVLVPLLALAIDGGLLWRQHIGIQNANDAAALSAAQTYARGNCPGSGVAAQASADSAAAANVSNAPVPDNRNGTAFQPQCTSANSGQVTVRYYTNTSTFFSIFNGGNHVTVTGKAVAKWGNAGAGSTPPFIITGVQLAQCPIDYTSTATQTCQMTWDKNLYGAEWGVLNLSNPPAVASQCQINHAWGWNFCPGPANVNLSNCDKASAAAAKSWASSPPLLELNPSGDTWVCGKTTGDKRSVWKNLAFPRLYCFPVSPAGKQWPPSGAPDAYDVTSFIPLYVTNFTPGGRTDILTVEWRGPQGCGSIIGGGPNTGGYAIKLIG